MPAILAASLIMGAVVWALVHGLSPGSSRKNGAVVQVAALLLLVGSGLAVYAGTAAALWAFDAKVPASVIRAAPKPRNGTGLSGPMRRSTLHCTKRGSIAMQGRPRRSVLYMPGSNERALEKAKTLPADALILDLEDAVAPDAKMQARASRSAPR